MGKQAAALLYVLRRNTKNEKKIKSKNNGQNGVVAPCSL
jgi:hypothetical protein